MDQKAKLKMRIQKMLQSLAEDYPPLIVEWLETAETAFKKWLAEHS